MTDWRINLKSDGLFISSLAILLGCSLGYGVAEGMTKLESGVDAWVAADNFVTWAVTWFTALIWLTTFNSRMSWGRVERRYIHYSIGALLIALGLHRIYWYPWRAHLHHDNAAAAALHKDTYVLLTTMPQSAWWFVCFAMCAPFYRRILGDAWPLYAILSTAAIWTVGYQGVAFFKPSQ
jgi:hypothetical protein